MPGPKMGPRPADFNESLVRQSPTFVKWERLAPGARLRYACREFIKGHGDDEERLMRRIMIARRNNIRDHETLKEARQEEEDGGGEAPEATMAPAVRTRRPPHTFSDAQVEKEMDVLAVVKTRSYRSWMSLPDGSSFVYNQKYIKGREGHDWLLRKNIWRRMRYRRENKQLVLRHKGGAPPVEMVAPTQAAAAVAAATSSLQLADAAAVEAAVAAAESFGRAMDDLPNSWPSDPTAGVMPEDLEDPALSNAVEKIEY